jgi:thioredoxin 1
MASANVLTLTQDNWDNEVVKSDKPVLVDFWAPWCGPCRALGPTIDRLADQFAGKVKVCKLNTDDNQDVAAQFGVSAIPLVLVLQGGKVKEKMVGLQTEAAYVKALNKVLEPTV